MVSSSVIGDEGCVNVVAMSRTLLRTTRRLSGVGIHSGLPSSIEIRPFDREGIWFASASDPSKVTRAKYDNVRSTTLRTELADGFGTIEHLTAALWGMRVTNALCVTFSESREMPILDGSSALFVDALQEAGFCTIPEMKSEFLVVKQAMQVNDNKGGFARLAPAINSETRCLALDVRIEFGGCSETLRYEHDWTKTRMYYFQRNHSASENFRNGGGHRANASSRPGAWWIL